MSSTWGNIIKVSVFGEGQGSHAGVMIDGLPAGEKVELDEILIQIARTAPGQNRFSSNIRENEYPKVLSGLLNKYTTGMPLCALMEDGDAKNSDYQELSQPVRPGRVEYATNIIRTNSNDPSKMADCSDQLIAGLTFAGAVCRQILKRHGIDICAHIYSIGTINDTPFDPMDISTELAERLCSQTFPVINSRMESVMKTKIDAEKMMQDSLGGVVECAVIGLDAGIGTPVFGGIQSAVSSIIFGLDYIKGVEFGNGFACAKLRGSENSDEIRCTDGKISASGNNHGGVFCGVSSGTPVIFRVAVKPVPFGSVTSAPVDMYGRRGASISQGRQDPCIVPRIVPAVESAAAIAILDILMKQGKV